MPGYIKMFVHASIAAACIVLGARESLASENDIRETTKNWIFPAGGTISDTFHTRGGAHKGIDIAGKYREKVFSADKGIVIRSYYSASYGNVVFIRHPSGYETVYAHLDERVVEKGQRIEMGGLVGYMGTTGDSTGTHLHFEVHAGKWTLDKKNAIDPFLVFGAGERGQLVSAKAHDPYGIAAASAPGHAAYIVKKGDTLWKISLLYHTSVDRLKSWNNMRTDQIYAGQVLEIENGNNR
ncbi:peptidase M23 [Weizmannia acidilactici]|uniref:Peptidase M23 n=1 Tax=Weizmannia acidilactici TaxID=2607726 RepID=A0A5J4JFJ7_9BACI|nr:peptidoglycan DD-metalloendopeptidase family protein [Weizmannia acidilactici]GER66058.1 peptidase M23 [Weizmannia acidilactici]GER69307.1 peptidase M23 [Weizmannia acidilactici]GER72367.1 peptidase M23 [Weizmannia acidilactici]